MESKFKKNVFLSFKLSKEHFAVNVKKVLEVLQNQALTEIPDTPDYVLGVMNFRGEIVPVVDTRKKFHLPPLDDIDKRVIIILELELNEGTILIGTTADSVKDVFEIMKEDIKEVPSMGNRINPEYISGMVYKNEKFIMLLNVDKIFTLDEIAELNPALTT